MNPLYENGIQWMTANKIEKTTKFTAKFCVWDSVARP